MTDELGKTGGREVGHKPEWQLLEKLAMSSLEEQRRSRRWGVVFKSLTFGYLFVVLGLIVAGSAGKVPNAAKPHTAVVNVKGVIADQFEANAPAINASLREAFKAENSRAILLNLNSPGGSPVQSGYIFDEILRLREKYPEKKVYAVIGDIGASGAYYIAAAADEIYADRASLVGSIGVVSASFGYVDLMKKFGVERRLFTAGENKALLDEFSPLEDGQVEHWRAVLKTTHELFISQVKKGRGDRLADNPDLFSGLVWTGEQALELGLIDGYGSPSYVAREVAGQEDLVDYTIPLDPLSRVFKELGILAESSIQALFQPSVKFQY